MIPTRTHELLEPLERFEDIRRSVVRLGPRLCDLAYANPYSGVQDDVRAAIRRALDEDRALDLQYTPFGGHALPRRATADALRKSHGLDFNFARRRSHAGRDGRAASRAPRVRATRR